MVAIWRRVVIGSAVVVYLLGLGSVAWILVGGQMPARTAAMEVRP